MKLIYTITKNKTKKQMQKDKQTRTLTQSFSLKKTENNTRKSVRCYQ